MINYNLELDNIDLTVKTALEWISALIRNDPEYQGAPSYSIYFPPELEEMLLPIFGKGYRFGIQTIAPPSVSIHKDGSRLRCYNYLLDPGGKNVETCFYDDDGKEFYKEVIPSNTWHLLTDTQTYHNVRNIETTRIAITVYEQVEEVKAITLDYYLKNLS